VVVSSLASYIAIQPFYSGSPNFISKVAPVASHINFSFLGELSQGFHDTQILDLIQYGFPLDLDKSNFLPNSAVTNHGSALKFPEAVDTYFRTETHFGAMLGPFPDPPFPDLHCSPHMTAHKDGSDLSFSSAQRQAVNASVSKFTYVGTPFSLKLLTVDIICQALNIVGQKVKIFKVELARAFRQLHVDPFDINYLGLSWRGAYYVDTSVPFGYHHDTLACVRVTDLIRYILSSMGILVLNYIDDIIGIAPNDLADLHLVKLFRFFILWVLFSKILTRFPPPRWWYTSVLLSTSKLGYFKFLLTSYRRFFLSVLFTFLNQKLQKLTCRLLLVLLCFYIRPLNLPGCSLTASWHSSGTWAMLLKRPLMRALTRTSDGLLCAPMRLTAPLGGA
jgi:hypothetical protein